MENEEFLSKFLRILYVCDYCMNCCCQFLANVNSSSGSLYVVIRPSVVCLSVCRL